ncbi:MAG: tRNA (N(6)-L-threonylcarbamoyladenosine(37)-C(2))-methylthiotransferase MtaB [Clostridia bacterium]|nr:tRNA (N(6)-L-threonylcarbamoyladenosine(37)-C(2))-methylthiotransferase MtaB [Clostridia bacterium]
MMNKKYSASIYTLGCRVNQYESEAVVDKLIEAGFEIKDFNDVCDIYIVNTCAVTGESDRKSRQYVRRAKNTNPKAHVIVMGCLSQYKLEDLQELNVASYICGNRNKLSVVDAAIALCEGRRVDEYSIVDIDKAPYENMDVMHSDNTRAYVKIEDGCDNNCAYCSIKYARGPVVSRLKTDVIKEVCRLAKMGYKEVVLTGVETASYGKDTGEKLADLIKEIDNVEGIERIRLGSLEPSVLTREFVETLSKTKKFMPSFHLSLQSGSSNVLAAMKRKYNAEQVLAKVDFAKKCIPNVTFTCDIIAGFPGETYDDYVQTCEIIEKIGFLHCHIFPFSKREGTEAAKMSGQILRSEKIARANSIGHTAKRVSCTLYSSIKPGTEFDVLFETPKGDMQIGHTPEMFEVCVTNLESLQGQIRRVRVVSTEKEQIFGELV